MPTLLNYFGIKASMNFIQSEHQPPHIHTEYSGFKMSVEILTLKTTGTLPNEQRNIVLEWVKNNQSLLLKIWDTQDFNLIKNNPST